MRIALRTVVAFVVNYGYQEAPKQSNEIDYPMIITTFAILSSLKKGRATKPFRNDKFFFRIQSIRQESIPLGCIPPSLHCTGALDREPSGQRFPWTENPPRKNMRPGTETPWKEHGARDRGPLEGTWDQAARQEVTSYRDPPCGQTNTYKIITLPQTPFAGGNNSSTHR